MYLDPVGDEIPVVQRDVGSAMSAKHSDPSDSLQDALELSADILHEELQMIVHAGYLDATEKVCFWPPRPTPAWS